MTENERMILGVLARRFGKYGHDGKLLVWERGLSDNKSSGWLAWWSPTQIALTAGNTGGSSWACRYLKTLRAKRLVRREPPGKYSITKKGMAALVSQKNKRSGDKN